MFIDLCFLVLALFLQSNSLYKNILFYIKFRANFME